MTGQVKPGEMLLVLGRPGAGCTSLLRVLSNHRESFNHVEGEVYYGSMDHVAARRFRQQITLNTEGAVNSLNVPFDASFLFSLFCCVPQTC